MLIFMYKKVSVTYILHTLFMRKVSEIFLNLPKIDENCNCNWINKQQHFLISMSENGLIVKLSR